MAHLLLLHFAGALASYSPLPWQVGGESFFLPRDAPPPPTLKSEQGAADMENSLGASDEFLRGCVSFSEVQDAFKAMRGPDPSEVSLFVLDCCRNELAPSVTPREGSREVIGQATGERSASAVRKHPAVKPPRSDVMNSWAIFSTTSGKEAQDGIAGNGGHFMNAFTEQVQPDPKPMTLNLEPQTI